MASSSSSRILILFGLVALTWFLIPSEVAARAIDAKSSLDRNDHEVSEIIKADIKTLRFDIYETTYSAFIKSVITILTHSTSHTIPVLMPQPTVESAANMAALDILLIADHLNITVKLDRSNLYLRGYSTSSNVFCQFLDPKFIFPGAQTLTFSGSYTNSGNVKGIVNAAGLETRVGLALGFQQMNAAISNLAKADSCSKTNSQLTAKNLLVLIQMISEAARFKKIAKSISDQWASYGEVKIDAATEKLENSWDRLSKAVRQMSATASDKDRLPNIPSDDPSGVLTLGQAKQQLGILLIAK